jgi:hypothetical protein
MTKVLNITVAIQLKKLLVICESWFIGCSLLRQAAETSRSVKGSQ